MTDEKMALFELIEKRADVDFIREMLAFAADRLMGFEVEGATGAALGAKSPDRLAQRNGYRERAWDTRVGTIDLKIPRLRTGSYLNPPGNPGGRLVRVTRPRPVPPETSNMHPQLRPAGYRRSGREGVLC
jgi:hypothetical protein